MVEIGVDKRVTMKTLCTIAEMILGSSIGFLLALLIILCK